MTKQFLNKALTTVAAAILAASPAAAEVHIPDLTGTVSEASSGSLSFAGDTFQYWNLTLNGLVPITLVQGDIVRATVRLDQTLTVPGTNEMYIGFNLFRGNGSIPPLNPVSTSGTMTFNPGGVAQFGPVPTGCGNCLSSIAFLGATNAVSFGSLYTEFTINTLTDPDYLIDGASISYQLRDPISAVPEPATWAMMIVGLSVAGAALRRRHSRLLPV